MAHYSWAPPILKPRLHPCLRSKNPYFHRAYLVGGPHSFSVTKQVPKSTTIQNSQLTLETLIASRGVGSFLKVGGQDQKLLYWY